MDVDLFRSSVLLPRGVTARLSARRGDRVECLAGTLWVTQDGDPRDVVLGAGDGFTVDRDGRTLVSALADRGSGDGAARYLLLAAATAATAAVA